MLNANSNNKAIALAIGKSESAISREINRNRDKRDGHYKAATTQRKYEKRQREKPKHISFTDDIKQKVEELIGDDLSPEQIAGRRKKQGLPCVSHERIYQHIWDDKKKGGSSTPICAGVGENTKKGAQSAQEGVLSLTGWALKKGPR